MSPSNAINEEALYDEQDLGSHVNDDSICNDRVQMLTSFYINAEAQESITLEAKNDKETKLQYSHERSRSLSVSNKPIPEYDSEEYDQEEEKDTIGALDMDETTKRLTIKRSKTCNDTSLAKQ